MSQLRRVATVATVCCSAAQETFAVSQAALDALKAANGIPVDDVSGSGISNSGSRMVEVEAQSTAVHSGFCGLKLKWSWWGVASPAQDIPVAYASTIHARRGNRAAPTG